LRSNNVDLSTNTLNSDEIKYLREDFEIPQKKKVQKGSLLMCISNGSKIHLGKVALIEEDLDFAFGGFMGLLTPNETVVYPKYFYYALISPAYKFFINSLSDGANINNLKFADLKSFDIPIPSLAEQKRIVEILDREFERIDALKANAEQNLQHAKDLFQAALKQELQPKEGWETKTIGQMAELKGGKRVPKGYKLEIIPTGYPYIRVADFNDNGTVDLDDIHYISKEVFEGIKRYIITTNDVYISIAGTIGKSGIIPEELNGANLTENACRLVFKEEVDKKYIYYCTISSDFKEQIAKLTMQAAQPKLALTRLATATLNLPSVGIQREIVARIDILNERCKALEENYRKTIALCDDMKQALLRKAFNGEL
jgi:type I restriction enzyme S subunit